MTMVLLNCICICWKC